MTRKQDKIAVELVDAASIHHMLAAIAQRTTHEHLRMNFPALSRCLRDYMTTLDANARQLQATVFAAVDPSSEAQQRLAQSWTVAGFRFLGIDFRACSMSAPPTEPSLRVTTSHMVAPICYALGTLRRYDKPTVIVLGHSFEYAGPLSELAKEGATVGLACFRSVLDPRWEKSGLVLAPKAPIRFFDLDDASKDLIGVEPFTSTIDQPSGVSWGF